MTPELEIAIATIQSLSTNEQLLLLQIISSLLLQAQTLETQSQDFWAGKSIESLINTQHPPIVTDLAMLKSDIWAEESIDEFLTFLQQQRQTENTTSK